MFAFFERFSFVQEPKKWNTKHDNGMRNASPVAYAKHQLAPNRSYHANKKSIVLAVMRRNMPLDASNAIRYANQAFFFWLKHRRLIDLLFFFHLIRD